MPTYGAGEAEGETNIESGLIKRQKEVTHYDIAWTIHLELSIWASLSYKVVNPVSYFSECWTTPFSILISGHIFSYF